MCEYEILSRQHSSNIDRPQSISRKGHSRFQYCRGPNRDAAGSCGMTKVPHVTSRSQLTGLRACARNTRQHKTQDWVKKNKKNTAYGLAPLSLIQID